MKIFEVLDVFDAIMHYYPNFQDKAEDINEVAQAWHIFLKDIEFETVMQNLAEHVKTNVYPPVIANLLKVPEKPIGRYIPTREEVLLDYAKRDHLLLANKATDEERIKAQEEVKKILNISEVNDHE